LEDHKLLEEAISHHELLAGTANVTVVVEETHAGETGDVNLKGYVSLNVEGNLSLLGGVSTHGLAWVKDVEGLVPDFINHYYLLL